MLKGEIMKRQYTLSLLLVLLLSVVLWGQGTENLSFTVVPGAQVPIGDSRDLFTTGGSVDINGEYSLQFLSPGFIKTGIGLSVMPTLADSDMNIIDLSLGAGIRLPVLPRLLYSVSLSGGMYTGIRDDLTSSDPVFRANTGVRYVLSRSLSLGAETSYSYYLSTREMEPLLTGLSISLGLTYHFGAGSQEAEIWYMPDMQMVFPVFYKYYDDHPVGSLILENLERGTIQNVSVSMFVPEYMKQPKVCEEIPALKRNEEAVVDLYALFSDSILKVTEGTKVSAEITVEYDYLGSRTRGLRDVTLTVNNRNAMTWDDDRKAAAFVTAKDPAVLRFAKGVAADIGSTGSGAVNSNFRTAVGMFEALSVIGIGYVIDPQTPYAELSETETVLDYLQFPTQTLLYRAGDCDDLSILYAALLESVGIETSFITVPGHIYMAFSPGIDRAEAERIFSSTENIIFQENEAWIPVEVTLLRDGFIKAWETGAREWRNNSLNGAARLIPVHSAWELYQPVGISENDRGIFYPSSEELLSRYTLELDKYIDTEIYERERDLKNQLRRRPDSPYLNNKLGVLYACFGRFEAAAAQFRNALVQSSYIPAILNLGNIYLINGSMEEARANFAAALEVSPDDTSALLGMAKASFELDDYPTVIESINRIAVLDPETAAKYNYLVSRSDDTGRASAAMKEDLIWNEE